ncbi:hypothetical protein ACFO1B_20635 [Dactylosporangium siamense]|uniref:Uncharacterized protein n=1 Tax=Dactylosporangium siamense TaxID=685454 RepID=A0A919UDP4_9ACTN|nr:hypothetical protein [Dactylosporangium siamense]GIG46858.1 hypothetical protein Dsi01nite_048990 [Dactylosporangium siamense]
MEFKFVQRAKLPVLIGATVAGFVAQRVSQTILDGFYARSGYPVPYYVGQLSFSADRLSGWYTQMRQAGTLGIYWQTQFVDFAFIAATALVFTAALALVARAFPAGTRGRRVATAMVALGPLGPLCDVVENLFSFAMLPDPGSINPVVAVLYSTAAALKFAGFFAVYLWIPVALIAAVIARRRR